MKKTLIFISATILIGFLFTACHSESKKIEETQKLEAADSLEKIRAQEAFIDNLDSYPSDTFFFLEEYFNNAFYSLEDKQIKLIKIKKGEYLKIGRNGIVYGGIISVDTYALLFEGLCLLPSGKILNKEEIKFTEIFEFCFEPLKSTQTREEIYPLLEKYELSVRAKTSFGFMLVVDLEDFRNNYQDVNEYILDPKGKYLVWIDNKHWIMNEEGKCWRTRKLSNQIRSNSKKIKRGDVDAKGAIARRRSF